MSTRKSTGFPSTFKVTQGSWRRHEGQNPRSLSSSISKTYGHFTPCFFGYLFFQYLHFLVIGTLVSLEVEVCPCLFLGRGLSPVLFLMLWNFFAFGLSFPVATSNNLASPLLCFSSGVYLLLGTFSSIAPSSTNCLPANPSSCYNFHQISSTAWVTKAIVTADWSSLDLHSKGVKVL